VNVLVYGLGKSGRAAARLAARQGHTVTGYDAADPQRWRGDLAALGASATLQPRQGRYDVCIASPGVPIDHPDLVALQAAGTEIIGEVAWVARTVPGPKLAVTGTAGKGTVTRWAFEILEHAGMHAVLGGNIDPPLAAVATPGAWSVTEVSSFQLERSPGYDADVAVITNLGRDHLDRHGTLATYHATKRRLIEQQSPGHRAIVNADDPVAAAWAALRPGDTWTFGLNASADVRLTGGRVWWLDEPLMDANDLPHAAPHLVSNTLAAIAAATAAGAPARAAAEAAVTFKPTPGRFETVAERCGVTFVDDSIATRDVAVAAALKGSTPPVAWILGGQDKGADAAELARQAADQVRLAVGIGAAGPAYLAALPSGVDTHLVRAERGEDAIDAAVRVAAEAARSWGGGTVLLAPLGASFDQFASYAERSDAFRTAVERLLKEPSWTGC
jgi:UDP-N-acetylmuramoylalanine--D-glutamate ligase